ncbi:dTDP-4-dehydrorhamnose reductase [Nocardia asteroides]|uniref:dTDP-4-dehydrorhamnose reductase n=1 Tax=Nocardia asteroides TaxID=1824 RepID=UPI001E4AA75B|nr:dTDP-4-dehydrorhamnose reductase [Nocardia asteroides]UGT64133.1 dTDP-4-dehydrorhamnose reductase [Nocardia asteroides]
MTDVQEAAATTRTPLIVTGANGQLGRELLRLAPHARGYSRHELDIRDPDAVSAALEPGAVVLNCAAYTAVDAAETDAAAAFAGNGTGPEVLAAACARAGARLVHLSTDYVFSGTRSASGDTVPYDTTDTPDPVTVYGRSKLAGERAVLASTARAHVVRTAWVYSACGADFVSTMLRLERERDTVDVVADQIGSPTFAADLAAGLLELAGRPEAPRLLHATNTGQASWFDLARAVFAAAGADPERVRPVDTAAFPRPARRPPYSVLSPRSWAEARLTPLREWQVALRAALARAGAGAGAATGD